MQQSESIWGSRHGHWKGHRQVLGMMPNHTLGHLNNKVTSSNRIRVKRNVLFMTDFYVVKTDVMGAMGAIGMLSAE